jgi:hypothetical protein
MGSISDHGVEVEHRGIQRQPKGSDHHGLPNGGEEVNGRGRDVVEPQKLKENIIIMVNNDGLDANMNFGHERFEDVAKVPLFEGSTLSSLFSTILILNCCQTQGVSNAFIAKLLALLKKNILP